MNPLLYDCDGHSTMIGKYCNSYVLLGLGRSLMCKMVGTSWFQCVRLYWQVGVAMNLSGI